MGDHTQRIQTLTAAGYKRAEIREMEAIRQWLSVNAARNVLLLITGLKRLALSSKLVWDLLPDRLRDMSIKQMEDQEKSLSLKEYDHLIQTIITEELGHVSKLALIGQAGPDINFGFNKTLRTIAKFPIIGPLLAKLASPWIILEKLNEAAAAWNVNKSWYAYRTGLCSARLVCVYNPGGPQNQSVNRLQDAPSLLHLIRGMNQALPTFFQGRKAATVRYALVELPIRKLLATWAPDKTVTWNGTELHVDGKLAGRLVWLTPDEGGMYNGDYSQEPVGNVRGIRMERDILTSNLIVREGEAEMLPIVYAGEIYQIDDELSPFGRSVMIMDWDETLGDRVARRLPWMTKVITGSDYQLTFKEERQAMGRAMHAATVAREAAIVGAIARTVHPDPDFFNRVKAGQNPLVADPTTVAMTVDIVSFTAWSALQEDPVDVGRFMQPFMTGVNQIVLHHDGKYNNFTGDGCVCVWMSALGRSKGKSLKDRLCLAIEAALEIAQLADEVGRSVRIGISVGATVTYTIPADETGIRAMPVTNGDAMNLSARAEGALKLFPMPKGSNIGLDTSKIPNALDLPGIGVIFDLEFMGMTTVKEQTFPFHVVTPAEGSDSSAFVDQLSMSMTMELPVFDTEETGNDANEE